MDVSKNDLFKFGKMVHEEGSLSVIITINPESEVFKGHFPQHPVVPGACMLQMVKEALENGLGGTLGLRKAEQLKFLNIIDPTMISQVHLEISYHVMEDESISATAKLSNQQTIYFKFHGTFVLM